MERKLLEGMMKVANTPDARPEDKILEGKLNEAATLKLDPIQTYVANGIVKWAVAQPKVKAASEQEGSLVNWINMGNQVMRLTGPAAAEGKSVSLDGVEAATLITLLDWASKSPDVIQQSENAIINYVGVAQSIMQAAKGTKVQAKPMVAEPAPAAPAEEPAAEPEQEQKPAAEVPAAEPENVPAEGDEVGAESDEEKKNKMKTESRKVYEAKAKMWQVIVDDADISPAFEKFMDSIGFPSVGVGGGVVEFEGTGIGKEIRAKIKQKFPHMPITLQDVSGYQNEANKKIADRRQYLAEQLYIIKYLKEQKRELTAKEKKYIAEAEKVQLTDAERAEVKKVFETIGKKVNEGDWTGRIGQLSLQELFKARDAQKVLEGLGLHDNELIKEINAEIQKKSGGKKDEAAY